MKKYFLTFVTLATVVAAIPMAHAAGLVFLRDFRLHDFDAAIKATLGFDSGSITYYKELASITQEQSNEQKKYEEIGCFPFHVYHNGKIDDKGYNCRSFYCIGYMKGNKQCRDTDDKAYGGVVEINRRLSITYVTTTEKPYKDFTAPVRTKEMEDRMALLQPIKCEPFYLMHFDVIVGDGYTCEAAGKYPNYSGAHTCTDDWRDTKAISCDIPVRDDEFAVRARGLNVAWSSASSSATSKKSGGSSSAVSSAASSQTSSAITFPDVIEGKYGYTAILSLAARGIIGGYPDGTFKPQRTVNRAEYVKLFMGGLHQNRVSDEAKCFPDVLEQWFSPFVCAAKRLGWVRGYIDGRFRGSQTMTRAEGIKIIVASMGVTLDSSAALPYGVPENMWYSPYIRKAVEMKIILEPTFAPDETATRADSAVWIYRAWKVQQETAMQ